MVLIWQNHHIFSLNCFTLPLFIYYYYFLCTTLSLFINKLYSLPYKGSTLVKVSAERIEAVDLENKSMTYSIIGGEMLEYYKTFKGTITVTPKGGGSIWNGLLSLRRPAMRLKIHTSSRTLLSRTSKRSMSISLSNPASKTLEAPIIYKGVRSSLSVYCCLIKKLNKVEPPYE